MLYFFLFHHKGALTLVILIFQMQFKWGTLGCSTFFCSINVLFDSDFVQQWKDRSFFNLKPNLFRT